MRTSPRPAVTPQAVVGVSICLMGIALTLDNLGLYEIRGIGQLWPVVPISIGVLTLMYGETKQDYVKGTLWLALGVFFIVRHPFVREVWPILLVALGGYLVWRSRTPPTPKRSQWEEEPNWDDNEPLEREGFFVDVRAGVDPGPFTNPAAGQPAGPAAQGASTAASGPAASTAAGTTGGAGIPPGVPPPIPEDYRSQFHDVRERARDVARDARQVARDALREARRARRRGPFGCGPRTSPPPPPGFAPGTPAGAPGTPGAAPGAGGPQAHEFSFAGFPPARPVPGTGQRPALFALMAGVRRQVTGAFAGAEATAIMGGVELDLRYAQADGDEVTIDTFALWGGIEIWVPPHWNIVSQGLPLMASFEDKTHVTNPGQGPRLVIRGVAVMGSVEIKN